MQICEPSALIGIPPVSAAVAHDRSWFKAFEKLATLFGQALFLQAIKDELEAKVGLRRV